jgi:hypothetical protein
MLEVDARMRNCVRSMPGAGSVRTSLASRALKSSRLPRDFASSPSLLHNNTAATMTGVMVPALTVTRDQHCHFDSLLSVYCGFAH